MGGKFVYLTWFFMQFMHANRWNIKPSEMVLLCLTSKILSMSMYLHPKSKQNCIKPKHLIKLDCPYPDNFHCLFWMFMLLCVHIHNIQYVQPTEQPYQNSAAKALGAPPSLAIVATTTCKFSSYAHMLSNHKFDNTNQLPSFCFSTNHTYQAPHCVTTCTHRQNHGHTVMCFKCLSVNVMGQVVKELTSNGDR